MSGGQLIELTGDAELDLGLMYLEPTTVANGFVFLYDNTSLWDGTVPGYAAQTVVATSSVGLEWSTTITDTGEFAFNLPEGQWDFTVDDAALNSSNVENYNIFVDIDILPTPIELFVYPEFLTIELHVFMDAEGDGVFANGTAVSPSFTLMPLNDHGQQHNYTAADYSSPGNITVVLELGLYSIQFNTTEASDENASDYTLTGANVFNPLQVGLEAYEEAVAFPSLLYFVGISFVFDDDVVISDDRVPETKPANVKYSSIS